MSTTFPRTVLPMRATWPTSPGPLQSWGQSGVAHLRSISARGRQWTEIYGPLKASNVTVRAWLAKVFSYWRTGETLDVYHISMQAKLGGVAGTPLVAGASQTGTSLVTDGWTGGTTIPAGEILRVAGDNFVQEVVASATAATSGTATLTLSPGIVVAAADDAAITANSTNGNVLFQAVIAEPPILPEAGPDEYYYGFTLTFRETG